MSRDRDSRDRDDDRRGSRDRDDDRGSSRGRDDRDSDRGSRSRDRDDDRGGRHGGRDDRDDRGASGSGRGYTYRERSADEVKTRSEMGAQEYDKLLKPGVKMWKPNDNANRIRILPPTWEGAKHYGLDVYVHYGVGPDRDSYICPHKMKDGDPCPVCEERETARRDDRPDEDYIKDLDAKRRVLVYLIDRDAESEGVQAWFMPWTLDKDITKVSVDRDTGEVLPLDHPEKGYDVNFDRTGKGNRTKYEGVGLARRSSPLGKDAWMDYAMDNPLPDQLNFYDYDHIAKAFGAKGQQRESTRGRDDRDERRDERVGRGRDDREGFDDRRSDRGRDSGRDRGDDDRRSRRDDPPELTWASVHSMTRDELEDLVKSKDELAKVDPKDAKDDDDLADWVCEDLGLKKDDPPAVRRRTTNSDGGDDRLREMRDRRDRG